MCARTRLRTAQHPMASATPDTETQNVQSMRPIQTKLVLLGEAAVGKSSVVHRFVQDEFEENREPTIGAAFLTQRCRLEDLLIKFEIWDTAGQERFRTITSSYYRGAHGIIVVYDVTDEGAYSLTSNVPEREAVAPGDRALCMRGRQQAAGGQQGRPGWQQGGRLRDGQAVC